MAIGISLPAVPPTPVKTEKGIPNRQCAPCSSPVRILSRTFAQEASLLISTLTPYLAYRPSSFAITTELQSVRGMMPRVIFSFEIMGTAVPPAVADELDSLLGAPPPQAAMRPGTAAAAPSAAAAPKNRRRSIQGVMY